MLFGKHATFCQSDHGGQQVFQTTAKEQGVSWKSRTPKPNVDREKT
jgi:hypothetical protein